MLRDPRQQMSIYFSCEIWTLPETVVTQAHSDVLTLWVSSCSCDKVPCLCSPVASSHPALSHCGHFSHTPLRAQLLQQAQFPLTTLNYYSYPNPEQNRNFF